MSTRKKPIHFVQRLLRRLWRSFNVLAKAMLNWVLRSLRVNKHRSRQSQAGFVLPTVVMVLLVVALLTTAIVIRSFDRAKNASNFRVDQAVLNAATPAIDRAKAKIERLLSPDENGLAGSPPGEGKSITDNGTISFVLSQPRYTFGDETQLKLVYNNPNAAPPNDPAQQTLETVWKFPIDTDNNGKYDTFTLYGIYFRNPPIDLNNNPTRKRTPIEARALPQATGAGGTCAANSGGSASSTDGWYQTDGQLKKAFFVYVANVPIAQADIAQLPPPQAGQSNNNKYEPYKGNKGFSALEMQEDQARISLDNNAVWYDDDLVISNVPTFRVNGRIHTNSNLMVSTGGEPILFYQVSATESCYYTRENGVITVGGDVLTGNIASSTNSTSKQVEVHRYPSTANEYIDDSPANATTTTVPREAASNIGAYDRRLNGLVQCALSSYGTQDATDSNVNNFTGFPPEVKTDFSSKYDSTSPSSGRSILTQVLTSYFAKRIRRVSYKEVPFGNNPYVPYADLTAACATMGSPINPPAAWMSQIPPQAPSAPVPPDLSKLATTDPPVPVTGPENLIGDRISVGNALPTQWLKSAPPSATYAKKGEAQTVTGATGQGPKQRVSQTQQLDDLGDTSRGGFWEEAAAYSGNAAKNYQELAGGLRIVTGAGIYIDDYDMTLGVGVGKRGVNSFLPAPPTAAQLKEIATKDENGVKLPTEIQSETNPTNLAEYRVVWPDTMPMYRWDDTSGDGQYTWGDGEVKRGDLQMRATVVYHHAVDKGTDQKPIACVATLYDPTNADTAQNAIIYGASNQLPDLKTTNFGTSINGIAFNESGLEGLRAGSNNAVLKRQANMIFPNGRWVNKPLKDALKHLATDGVSKLTLNEIASIDAANCALLILYNPTPVNNSFVPLGAIQERTFLDARQVKAIHKRNTDTAGQPLTRTVGATSVPIDRQTLLEDITDPAKLKIAELGSLAPIDPATKKESSLPPEYSLPIEQRQPLEIRVTQIDLDKLRTTVVASNTGGAGITNNTEYMLPNTGIIYATRDDALPDVSDSDGGSATDFKLDPTRRPNGIRLINGQTLSRGTSNTNRLAEKGLILASDLPVYIKGSFNLHAAPNPSGSPTFKEEFTSLLPDGFTKTQFYGRTGLDKSFACREGSGCLGAGDQWRPARILADAVTLLSGTFRDGYRQEGDFDLNNNIGNLAVEDRLKHGFWWNNFVTTNPWYGTDGYPTDLDTSSSAPGIQDRSSYLTNGVTPIQRRVNFPEYKMEICRKFPVSECTPTDWVLENNDPDPTKANVGSGTTGPISDDQASPRYVPKGARLFPRRVAFKRQGGLLAVEDCTGSNANSCNKPIPIGVNSDGTTAEFKYGSPPPPTAQNTLWFATTAQDNTITNTNSAPLAGLTYTNTNQLFYRNPYEAETVSEKQLLLPGLDKSLEYLAPTGLNGTGITEASDYAVYTLNGANCALSQTYKPETGLATGGTCTTTTSTALGQLWTGLRVPTASAPGVSVNNPPLPLSNVRAELKAPAAQLKLTLKAQAKVNVYDLPINPVTKNSELSNVEITLDRNYQPDPPLFIFRAPVGQCATPGDYAKCNIEFQYAVKMRLKGVDPNNVFWVTEQDHMVRIHVNTASVPNTNVGTAHELTGNFIGGGLNGIFLFDGAVPPESSSLPREDTPVTVTSLTTPVIYGGRILGFNGTYPSFPLPSNAMTAMTVVDQPALLPVLQLHSAQGTPGDFGTATINQDYWVQRVPKNTPKKDRMYNAVFIMGDSPSRPLDNTVNPGESSGGLPNFPRFLEAWENAGPDGVTGDEAINDIKGSFIQFKKSAFATAPFEAIDDPTKDNSLFFDSPTPGALPAYMTGFNEAAGRPYIYKGGGQGRKAPYYRPPQRQWGYDVGLLTQTPDLFSRRFANPTVGTPNQYFRQVNRNDPWIETLLCAAQPQAGGAGYQRAIADPKELPSNCPPLADFN